MSVEVILFGASGRMGQEIAKCAETEGAKIAQAVDADGWHALRTFSAQKNKTVAIDFSHPDASEKVVAWAEDGHVPLVCGTTGLSEKQQNRLRVAAQKIPVFYSANMSVGIYAVQHLLPALMEVAGDWDIQMEEMHHNKKKDAPSGTALRLYEQVQLLAKRSLDKPVSLRGGGVFGDHRIWFLSEDESIMVEHRAFNRAVFARGALRAAKWLKSQGPGFYSMSDLYK